MIDYTPSYRFDYFCGWRYLISPTFREQMRVRWGKNLWTRALCSAGIFTSLLITTSAAVLALLACWHLMNE
jgi:hypothetical protein